MKIKLALLLLLLTSSLQLIFSQNWEYSDALSDEWMRKICTQGLDTVYIVGNNGLIARSTDRSQTWTKQYPVTAQLNDIVFCNHTIGFAVGNNGTILKTIDSGESWTQQNSGVTVNLNAMTATGIDKIWIVGNDGIVVFSSDIGTTWQVKDLSTTVKLNDISFKDNVGYIVGDNSTCYKTEDAGINWSNQNLNTGNNYIVQQTKNENLYILYNNNDNSNLYVNGVIKSIAPSYFPTSVKLSSFYMLNDSIGYGGILPLIPTGSSSYGTFYIFVYKNGNCIGMLSITDFGNYDYNCSDIVMINDTVGYAITSSSLLKYNKNITGIENLRTDNNLVFKQNNNQLIVTTDAEKINELEIVSISGYRIYIENGNVINVEHLPSGIYLIKAIFANKSFAIKKWIKH